VRAAFFDAGQFTDFLILWRAESMWSMASENFYVA